MPTTRPPLTARSVIASTLLGTEPPALPVAFLVRSGALFGLAEGTVRTALSRMAAAGEVSAVGDGWYELTGALVQRQQRQRESRAARTRDWDGNWFAAVVVGGARPASDRADLRAAMLRRRFAELREGVWTRPTNLETPAEPLDDQCRWFSGSPLDGDAAELAASLWDLDDWAEQAGTLRREMAGLFDALTRDEPDALAPGFVLSAAVLRHFGTDPLLPTELLPARWPGTALRDEYDEYDEEFRRVLERWVRADDGGSATTVVP